MKKNMKKITCVTCAAAALLAAGPAPLATAGIGPTSTYFVLDGENAQMAAFDSGGLNWLRPPAYGVQEFPIAVNGAIRTTGSFGDGLGGLYDLNGVPQGTTYSNPGFDAFDSTTDGDSNYLISWDDGAVYRTDADYSNPVSLFQADSEDLGITYDPRDNTLWIAAFLSGEITQYDLSGNVLGGFNTGLEFQSALALDHADGTLWVYDARNRNRFLQWDTDGTFLGEFNMGVSGNWLGGEFNLPAPSVFTLFIVAGLASKRRRR